MKKNLQVLFIFSFILFFGQLFAQKKYALIVGINQYYDQPGVLHGSRLRGCVNDANSMKGLLTSRFAFEDNNIIELTDEQASRNNVETAIQQILKKVKAGDAFVFFFSGHGVWMDNNMQNEYDRKLKLGMNQAIVLSNLYADSLKCLFRDADVKKMFNKFIDKKVIATAILDCCFSGNLSMGFTLNAHNPYSFFTQNLSERSMSFEEVVLNYKRTHSSIADPKDAKWYSVLSAFVDDDDEGTKGFNLKDNLNISDSTFIARPSERPHSGFLSVAGTNEYQKGEEMKDASGAYHGVFTEALLQVMENSPTDIPVSDLFKQISSTIAKNGFNQTPVRHQDPIRDNQNLIGVQSVGFKNNIELRLKAIDKNGYSFDKGSTIGIKQGNIFSLNGDKNKAQVQIIKVEDHTALARLIKGSNASIKLNDLFVRTDNYSKTNPLIKLYISLLPITVIDFEKNMQQKVIPLSQLPTYRHYSDWNIYDLNRYLFYNQTGFSHDTLSARFLNGFYKLPFFVFLPLPNEVFADFQKALQLNQNIELVNKPEKADFVLYLNYIKNGFALTWAPYISAAKKSPVLYNNHLEIAQLPHTKSEIEILTKNLMNFTTTMIQNATGVWLNDQQLKRR